VAAVATVDQGGLVSGHAEGVALITATSEGKAATATITVQGGGLLGPAGGVAVGGGGNVVITVPPQALAAPTALRILPLANPPYDPRMAPETMYDFLPHGVQFAAPVTVAIRYQPAALASWVDPAELVLQRLVNGAWTPLHPGTVDQATRTVTGTTTSFSGYGLGLVILPVVDVTITPANPTVQVGRTVDLEAHAVDPFGQPLVVFRSVRWESTAPHAASVEGRHLTTGRVTGILPGHHTIKVTVNDSRTASTTVTVTEPPPPPPPPPGTFTLRHAPTCSQAMTMRQGALDDRRIIAIDRDNFDAPILFTVEGLPSGLTTDFDSNPATAGAVRLRLVADQALPGGIYPLTIRGTGPGGKVGTLPLTVDVYVLPPGDPDQLVFNFTGSSDGWLRGWVCPGPGAGHADWGQALFQENMVVLDGRGPLSGRQEPNAWINRAIRLPPTATLFRFDASAHFLNDSRTRVRVRVVDGQTSTVVLDQIIQGGGTGVRTFQTYQADISGWAGRTVWIVVEQLDDLASHGQLWLDTFRVIVP
jgi:hypothetical protein